MPPPPLSSRHQINPHPIFLVRSHRSQYGRKGVKILFISSSFPWFPVAHSPSLFPPCFLHQVSSDGAVFPRCSIAFLI